MNKLRQRLLNRKQDKGFTLIELVIVVVIIGILTAIAIPSYGAIQGNAKQKAVNTAAKDQFVAAQAAIASGSPLDTSGYTQASYNSNIAVSVTKSRSAEPLSENNINVSAVWLKKAGQMTSESMDYNYAKNMYTLADGRIINN